MPKPLKEIIEEHEEYEGKNRRLEETNDRLRKQIINWKRQARYDDLTGLMRRGTFDRLVKKLVERSKKINAPLGYILVDIDHFKSVNDTYGHDVGDEVLKEVAYVLGEGVRESDVVGRKLAGRLGGEEMALLLPNTDVDGTKAVAERLRKAIQKHFKDKKVNVTISAGISEYIPEKGEGISGISEALYKTADEKLYKAKEGGRNKVVY